jgi:primosomal protein N''
LGIEIEAIGTEVPVGRFKIDILAKEPNTNEQIIIENQLEPTNHDHLGKVITYAAGLDARYLIWIVKDVLPEHLKAIEWLNEHLDEAIRCFLIRIEVWQIGDSKPAPRFEIISLKNDWVATLKKSTNTSEVSPLKLRQQEFWSEFCEYVRKNDPVMKLHKPAPQHWLNFSMGNSIAHLAVTMNTQKNRFSTELYISDNKTLFAYIKENEEEIKSQLGDSIDWFEANVAAGMNLYFNVDDVFNQSRKEEYFFWLYSNILKFKKVLTPYIQEFKAGSVSE